MADVKERLPAAARIGYDEDFHQMSYDQAALVRAGWFSELEIPNLFDELEGMGSEQRFSLESSYHLIVSRLLRWRHQQERRSRSWRLAIQRERANVARHERRNPSLRAKTDEIVAEIYPQARREAAIETGPPLTTFPAECPFTLAQLRDDEFLPE
jgi:hypothetical protein